jgi:hypothetical protein
MIAPVEVPPNQVEMVAEPQILAVLFLQDGLDALQESNRDRAAHAAAVKRENPLTTGAEQVPIARQGKIRGVLGHARNPEPQSITIYYVPKRSLSALPRLCPSAQHLS